MTILGSIPERTKGRHKWHRTFNTPAWECITHCSAVVSDFDVEDYELFHHTFIGEIPEGLHDVWVWRRDILEEVEQ